MSFEISYSLQNFNMSLLALTLTNIRNQVARPTSRVSVPASQLAKQPASRPAKTLANWRYSQPSAGRPAGRPAKTLAN